MKRRAITGAAIGLSAVTIAAFTAPSFVHAADHLDAPAVNGALQSPGGRHDADIADLYVFHSPQSSNRTVLAMTTHPFLGAITTDPTYGTDIRYDIHLDAAGPRPAVHGDDNENEGGDDAAQGNRTLEVTFKRAAKDGSQAFKVTLISGSDHEVIGRGRTNRNNKIEGGWAFAGKVSDPFFFDLGAFNNTVQARLTQHILPLTAGAAVNCAAQGAVDTFAAANVNAIVLEVPTQLLGGKVNVWAATVGSDGTNIDRMARPAINTVFNGKKALLKEGVDNDKNLFNAISTPSQDPTTHTSPGSGPTFRDNVVTVLTAFDGVAQAVAGIAPRPTSAVNGLADVLLPDVLPYDPAVAATNGIFNGRSLTDDVIDNELPVVTNGLVTTDCVGPHSDYRSTFPYLGVSH
jgi:hypothetical protein